MPKPESDRVCVIDDCYKDFYAKNMCKQHYMKLGFFYKNSPQSKPEKFDVDDFWEFVKKELKLG